MQLFLSQVEVAELTGRKQRRKQVEQLIFMRLPFTLDAFGWPKVLRQTIEAELGLAKHCVDTVPLTINYDKLSSFGKA
jgi:hypothetical protein